MTDQSVQGKNVEKETTRLEAFSDAVFAIAITLLALELKVPHLEHNAPPWALVTQLLAEWTVYFALITGFSTILVLWVNHHHILQFARRVDASLLYSNGFLLLTVTLFPFVTALLADYLTEPAANIAVMTYAGLGAVTSLAWIAIWWSIAYKRRLLKPDVRNCGSSFHYKQTSHRWISDLSPHGYNRISQCQRRIGDPH